LCSILEKYRHFDPSILGKVFQSLRIYVNDEVKNYSAITVLTFCFKINELRLGIKNSSVVLPSGGIIAGNTCYGGSFLQNVISHLL